MVCDESGEKLHKFVTIKERGMNVATRMPTYKGFRYDRVPDKRIEGRDIDESFHGFPSRG